MVGERDRSRDADRQTELGVFILSLPVVPHPRIPNNHHQPGLKGLPIAWTGRRPEVGGSHRARNVGRNHVTRQQGASQCCGSADFPEWLPSLACSSGHTLCTPHLTPFSFPSKSGVRV